MKITFIGGGNMASALIGGLLARDYARDHLEVVDVSPNARAKLERAYSLKTYPGPTVAPLGDCIVLAVKPQHVRDAVLQLTQSLSAGALVVSIAAGIRTRDLSRWLGGHQGIVRVMPNTPALVRAAISALFAMPAVTQEQKARAENILSAVGETLWLEDESQMDAITGISGSGPAYVFYFLEALTEAARQLGFDAKEARRLALATFNGSLKLASKSNEEFATLRANVTSKGGTTERAIKTMDAADVKSSIARAVRAAAERSQEIGRELGEN
jgi:pyrroline-5-carboxylate reductase